MSIASEITRINQNIASTYNALGGLGADIPASQNSDNLSATAETVKAVLYGKAQSLTDAQKQQAKENIGIQPLIGTSDEITPSQVAEAVQNGRDVVIAHTDPGIGTVAFTYFIAASNLYTVISSAIFYFNGAYAIGELMGNLLTDSWQLLSTTVAQTTDIPTALPNPNALTFTGAVTGSYDGSSGVVINIPETTSDNITLPSYWKTHIDARISDIRAAMAAAGRNKTSFLWYTDSHWGYGSGMSPMLLKYLHLHTAINKTNYGGDILNGTDSDIEALWDWREAIRDIPNHHSVIGNHDYGDDAEGVATDAELYSFLFAPEENGNIVWGGYFYYYIDDVSEKTRYIYLDTGNMYQTNTISDEETEFVIKALNTAEEGWHIVPVSHIWFLYDDVNTPTVGSVPPDCQMMLDLFDAYNARQSGSVTMDKVTHAYDFTGGKAFVEFCIGGHLHVDYDFTSTNGIPVILTMTDSYHNRLDNSATEGTITEAAVNAIVANYESNEVSVIRIGRGSSRVVKIENNSKPVAYTNWIPISKSTYNGNEIYNGIGYKPNTRISVSGGYSESTTNGVSLTGYIPINAGDVIRFYNMQVTATGTGYTGNINVYNPNGEGVNGFSFKSDNADVVVGDDGYVTQYTISKNTLDWNDSGYFRISAQTIDSTSIITINEEIP